MIIELFLSLVLAHLVADFVLQTGKSCKDKKERHWKSPHHYVHALIVPLLFVLARLSRLQHKVRHQMGQNQTQK